MNGIAAYKEVSITSQSRGQLIVMLYEGAIRELRLAIDAMEERDWAEKGERIGKALGIIQELDSSLDLKVGGEIAANLRKLYRFMVRHLGQANMQKDPQKVAEIVALLEDLNTGWKTITS